MRQDLSKLEHIKKLEDEHLKKDRLMHEIAEENEKMKTKMINMNINKEDKKNYTRYYY